MSYIKCPHCQHSALSVASRCPGCGAALGALTLGPEHKGALVPCISCGHLVRSRSISCPLCGAKNPGKKPGMPRRAAAIGAVAALGAVVIGGWSVHAGLTSESQAASVPVTVLSPRPEAKQEAAEIVVAAPARALAITATTVETVAPAAGPATRVDSFQTRWTALWANVREEPQESALVLDQLPPGTRLDGVRQRSGWWRVYLYGDSIGYVAGALLQKQPPDSSAAPR